MLNGHGLKYGTIYADPPWPEQGGGKIKRGADRHYPLMSVNAICALPVAEKLAAENAHLYLWVTNNFLPAGLRVMEAWGFRYVTCITWGKVKIDVTFDDPVTVQTGLGQYYRGASEQLLFGVRGSPPYRTDAVTGKRAQGKTLVLAPRGAHSAKPDVFRQTIKRVSHGPFIELFAREAVPGWDNWGNTIETEVVL